MKKAMYFEKIENGKVHCRLCPHNCVISPDKNGACGARKNVDGQLYSLNYGKVSSFAMDPIEKKPLHRFHPGSLLLSAGSFGCNLKCSFCQNWTISHENPETVEISSRFIVDEALKYRDKGCIGIAYTYNEPMIWYEFVYDTSKAARKAGLKNVLVTNGFVNREPLEEILPFIDAMNIDIKAFTAKFYKDICKASLDDVKRTVEISAAKCHVELTTLVIPGLNDSIEEIGAIARWIADINPEIPLHLSRFFPNYLMRDKPATPRKTLERAGDEARKYLKYVYLGNLW